MLDPTNNSVVTWSTVSHDRVSTAISTTYGDTLETLSISALNHLNRSFTDGAGRTVETQDAENNVAYAIYDNNGNPIRTRDANAVGRDCDFDPRGRLTSCTDTQGDTTTTTYNDNNQVLSRTDGKGVANKADNVFDARGRPIESTSRLTALDKNFRGYDPNSNLLTQTDAQGGVTAYEYNPRNLRTATLMPGHNPSSVVGDSDYDAELTFDAMRRPLLKTDQLGDTCVYTYDLASRLLTRDYRTAANSTLGGDGLPSGGIADTDTFTHDDASRPLTAVKGRYSNTVTFAYDEIGRPTSEALTIGSGGGVTYTVGYTNYDDDSRLTTLTYPDGSTVTTSFTARNQAEDIDYKPSGGVTTTIATMSYDAGMRHTTAALGNGLTPTYAYREDTLLDTRDNMLESITVAGKAGLTFDYTYDANKNMTAEDTGGVMDDYGIDLVQDAKDRMTSWTRDTTNTALDSQSWTLSFESDWDDTTLTDGGTGTTQTRTHNAPHELLTIDPDGAGGLPAFSQTYDAKGNLTADGDGLTHTFDFDNMLSQAVVSSASPRGVEGTHSYTYDALGRRVSKTVNPTAGSAVTTVFVCAGQQVIAEYTPGSGAANPERKYIFCATGYIDEPVALIDATGPSEDTYYYHRNRQFSIIGLTDDTGTVIERYAYTAYGQTTVLDAGAALDADGISDVLNPYTYTGRRLDDETGLHYFRARYHDAVLGRFLERDPLGYPDGLNSYAAYHVMWGGVDPSGLSGGPARDPGGHHEKLRERREERRRAREESQSGWATCCDSNGNEVSYNRETHCCEDGALVEKVTVYIVNRGGGPPGHMPEMFLGITGGHTDLIIPGCGIVDYFTTASFEPDPLALLFRRDPGVVFNTPEEFRTYRPWYQDGSRRDWICEIKVCPSQAEKMCDEVAKLDQDPGKFNGAFNNCSTNACDILGAGGVGSGRIPGFDTPQDLQVNSGSQNCYYGRTIYDPVGGQYKVFRDRDQSHHYTVPGDGSSF
ncbi:MAG: RHS repeat-associated core domain-containing protein [Planctomycetota bacterium]